MAIDYNRPFAWEPRRFGSVAEFRTYINGLNIAWAVGITLHHTWSPTRAAWNGLRTMLGMKRTYLERENGTWDSGPHLYIAPDGIWQGTPVTRPGIAAGKCNKDHIQIEIVGNYDIEPWPMNVQAVVFGVADAILDKLVTQVTETTVNGHRECLPNKTCPGAKIDMNQVRAALKVYRGEPVSTHEVPSDRPPGTYPVHTRLEQAWKDSGGVWDGTGILAPGFAIAPEYTKGTPNGEELYQKFERAMARVKPGGRVEWLLLSEIENE